MDQKTYDALERIPILDQLDGEQRRHVIGCGHERVVGHGEFLFHEAETAEAMFALIEGRVKLVKVSPDGRELLLHLVNPGQTFAEAALFGRGTYPASAQAVDRARVWCFPRDRLLAVIAASPDLALAMLASLSKWTRRLATQLDLLTQRRVEERLAVYLVGCCREGAPRSGQVIRLEDAKNLVAAQIGTAPEVLSRTFRRLEKAGVVRVTDRSVEVLDGEALRALAAWIDEF